MVGILFLNSVHTGQEFFILIKALAPPFLLLVESTSVGLIALVLLMQFFWSALLFLIWRLLVATIGKWLKKTYGNDEF